MSEELKEWLTKYRAPEIRFPQEGNEVEEHLADQIDQRLWSYMYGPGMQMFMEKVDDRVKSGITLMGEIEKSHGEKIRKIEKGHEEQMREMERGQEEKIHEMKLEQERGRGELEGKMRTLKMGLWGVGGAALVGFGGLGLYALWPKIRKLLAKKDEKEHETKASKRKRDGTMNYFRWGRERPVRWE